MRYLSNSAHDQERMLKEMGLASVEALFSGIPEEIRLQKPLDLPAALSEPELLQRFSAYEKRNAHGILSFLGGGVYYHHIPTVIDSLISRAEFFTSYTPYQPEIAQGTLQAIYEFQTFMCQLTGMEVSNASLYDGSTALTEAVLMASRLTRKSRFLVASTLHPEYRAVAETYSRSLGLRLESVDFLENGTIDRDRLEQIIGNDTAAIVVQCPNFFGSVEPLRELADLAHRADALLVVAVAEALSMGILQAPGPAGADIVCGEVQSLGIPPSFGGPYAGFLTTREKYLRNMPGRLVGQTVDADGKRGFVLTLSTREQHIRREKATSNICTNQSLYALMAAIYCSLLGKSGIREVAVQNVAKTQYALAQLRRSSELEILFEGPRFNEFVVRFPSGLASAMARCEAAGIVPGLSLQRYYSTLPDSLLISVTETKSRADIDRLAEALISN
ncbi:MAG: aminomethyl-transferring glycine dehydrogenase subunit GcvPA [Acidobacteriota bacterium]